ncbi:Nif3-like dinuclear metal center hexameric protein [Solirubrobacter sp. CPCC 204708]|nr:Nif3-like dinuclear metal center hexameric protein [Solirubrobacter deserti]
MAQITDILSTLDELLKPSEFDDLGPNGLQVPGAEEVTRVVTGVSARRELHERAVELGAQLVLVHHGLFWKFHPTGLTPLVAERLRPLLVHDINLVAYHLPLDAHPEVGNNALLARALGCVERAPFGDYKGRAIGCRGRFPEPLTRDELGARVHAATGREPLLLGKSATGIRSIGIVSGSAADTLHEAAALGLDAFLTGEPREHITADAEELAMTFVAAGHYATETFGVRALGELLADRFGVDHVFVELSNPV